MIREDKSCPGCHFKSDDKKEKENTEKHNFQGQSARTKGWFDIDHEWLKENFITRELDFYKIHIKLNLGVTCSIPCSLDTI